MGSAVNILGALTTLGCAILLLKGYRRTQKKLLLWSGLCFFGLAISNFLIFVDLVLVPNVNLYELRLGTTLLSMSLLLYGLIWDSR
jgi:uncharacterized membrane protein YesL